MTKCPTCGHDPDDRQQKRAAVSRWAGMSPEQRSAEMKRIRRKGLEKKGRRQNDSLVKGELYFDQGHQVNGLKVSTNPLRYIGIVEHQGVTKHEFFDDRTSLRHWLKPERLKKKGKSK